jgi:small-conductance mechanosensitive channel
VAPQARESRILIRVVPDARRHAVCERDIGRRCEMSAVSHEPSVDAQEKRRWSLQLLVPEMWACLAIVVMWLAVLFDAVFGPDIMTSSAGGDHSIVPSAVVVALFAFLATWVVAKYGFRHERKE